MLGAEFHVRSRLLPSRASAALLATLALLAIAAGCGGGGGDGDDNQDEIVLEPVGSVQRDDFAGNLDSDTAAARNAKGLSGSKDPRSKPAGADGRTAKGGAAGLYGGSLDTQVCDTKKLVRFLTDPANSDIASAWADTLGIQVDQIPRFVRGLTAVRLSYDTRVTNHGYSDSQATAFQSTLEAGTAVLVDDRGVPIVKCNCGNPLLEPREVDPTAIQNPDAEWRRYRPADVVTVRRAPKALKVVVLVDFDNGDLFDRPIGSNGASGDVVVGAEGGEVSAESDCTVTAPDGQQLAVEVQAGALDCTEATDVFERYFGGEQGFRGSGGFAEIDNWLCHTNSPGEIARGETVVSSCERDNGDTIVARVVGEPAAPSPETAPPPESQADCPPERPVYIPGVGCEQGT